MPSPQWMVKCQCGANLVSTSSAANAKVTCPSCGWSYTKSDLVPVLKHPSPHYADGPPR